MFFSKARPSFKTRQREGEKGPGEYCLHAQHTVLIVLLQTFDNEPYSLAKCLVELLYTL